MIPPSFFSALSLKSGIIVSKQCCDNFGIFERNGSNPAFDGQISSVVTLSLVFKITFFVIVSFNFSPIGNGLIFGPITISTFFLSFSSWLGKIK